jgi:hypothetical protein
MSETDAMRMLPAGRVPGARSRGQAMVEFALVLPILALLLVMAVDFGRVFFGWVGLQNAVRIGANFGATHPDADWTNPADPDREAYVEQIEADAAAINCDLPDPLDVPTFPEGTDVGDISVVSLTCDFHLLSVFLAPVFGGTSVTLSAESTFPIRYGPFTGISGGGEPPPPPPPTCRIVPDLDDLTVANARDAWTGAGFNEGTFYPVFGQDTEIVVPNSQLTNPASNPGDCEEPATTVTVDSDPPPTTPCGVTEGRVPQMVGLKLQNANAEWDSNGFTGSFSPTVTPSNKNNTVASQSVSPSTSVGTCAPLTTTATLTLGSPPPPPDCTVPNFIGSHTNGTQSTWEAAGFTTTVTYKQQNSRPYVINEQNKVSNSIIPCSSGLQVGP